jgi:hypothetical protein
MLEVAEVYEGLVLQTKLAQLRKRVEAINRKAKKLGGAGFLLTTGGAVEVEEKVAGHKVNITHIPVIVSGVTPMIAGWTFVGKITHESMGNLIITPMGGGDLPERYREVEPVCEHCGTSRFRKETFVLRNEAGEYKQVGRNCLTDFLGGNNPAYAILYASFVGELEEGGEEDEDGLGYLCGSDDGHYKLETYLSAVAFSMRRFGWVSRTQAKEEFVTPTASDAWWLLAPKNREEHLKWESQDFAEAEAAIAWAKTLGDGTTRISDYEYNLWTLARAGQFPYHMDGFAASMINAHHKAREKALECAKRNEWVGNKKDKVSLRVQLVNVMYMPSRWPTTLHKFQDEQGRVLVWFAASEDLSDAVGRWGMLTGTVKEHDTYNGVLQTTLTRCKFVGEV